MNAPGIVDIIRSHYAASGRGDLDGMFVDMHPQVRWTEAAGFPYAGTYVGRDCERANAIP